MKLMNIVSDSMIRNAINDGLVAGFEEFCEFNGIEDDEVNLDVWRFYKNLMLKFGEYGVEYTKVYARIGEKVYFVNTVDKRIRYIGDVWGKAQFPIPSDEIHFYNQCVSCGLDLINAEMDHTMIREAYVSCMGDDNNLLAVIPNEDVYDALSKRIYRKWLRGVRFDADIADEVLPFIRKREKCLMGILDKPMHEATMALSCYTGGRRIK